MQVSSASLAKQTSLCACVAASTTAYVLGHVSHKASNETVYLGMLCARFEVEFFNDLGGFRVSFEDSSENLTSSWRDVTTRCQEVMFFERRFEGSRPYDALLRDKANPQ